MARDDWFYVNLPNEMGHAFDYIISKEGKKYAIYDRKELVRQILRDFLMKYEHEKGLVQTREVIRSGRFEALKPID